jgi:hypothetical protein
MTKVFIEEEVDASSSCLKALQPLYNVFECGSSINVNRAAVNSAVSFSVLINTIILIE